LFGILSEAAAEHGVVVESTALLPGCDLRPGDRLIGWRRPATPANPEPAEGRIDSPFSLRAVEINESPRGTLVLLGTRDGAPLSVSAEPGEWTIRSRPELPPALLEAYEEGVRLNRQGETAAGSALWIRTAEEIADRAPKIACWLWLRAAEALVETGAWEPARQALQHALERARAEKDLVTTPQLLEVLAAGMQSHGELADAEALLNDALEQRRQIPDGALLVAATLDRLGELSHVRGEMQRARELYAQAVELQQKVAPDSPAVASTVIDSSFVNAMALAHLLPQALAIEERLAAPGETMAQAWTVLGAQAYNRGDVDAAQSFYRKAGELDQKLHPESERVARSLNNLAAVAGLRGDLAGADDMLRHATRILERLAPGSRRLATVFAVEAGIALRRGDLDEADRLCQRALAVNKEYADSLLGWAIVVDQGNIAFLRGDRKAAHHFYSEASDIWTRWSPDKVDVETMLSLADLVEAEGAHSEARQLARRALEAANHDAPDSYYVANSLVFLADRARADGDLEAAEEAYNKAIGILEHVSPASQQAAQAYDGLGHLQQQKQEWPAALRSFLKAVDALEGQLAQLGGAQESKASFQADQAGIYRDAVEALVESGQADGAFQVLERSRARLLLAMLAERDLVFADEIPEELDRQRRRIDRDYDAIQTKLLGLSLARDRAEVDRLRDQERELRRGRDALAEQIRAASPRLASLKYPQPLDRAGVQAALDPGTVLLSYSVGKDATLVFVLGSQGPVSVSRVPEGRGALAAKVKRLQDLVQDPDAEPAQLSSAAKQLYRLLLQPAEPALVAAQRILICPDGPLQTLPWAVLERGGQYLIEWKPLHLIVSGTVYAEILKNRPATGDPRALRAVAFGDPNYPRLTKDGADTIASPEVRHEVMRGGTFEPLPATRREVESLTAAFGPGLAKYLGDEATEERAKSLGKDVKYVHFACHGIVDERFPLNSALALSIPEHPAEDRENGLLQAWEIFERIRLDADLVTLSACKSGLGAEMGGEGLLGLTRAFQYAGARTVLASLWSIPDRSTAELMRRFYGFLHQGDSKDSALRRAQLAMIHAGGAYAQPLRWAGFQLTGDWR
jgi:CHAT domain-containing protein/Tfp pilus assembly protein PilF